MLTTGAKMDSEAYAACLRFELNKRGLTLVGIADEVGVSASLVSKTLKKQRKNAEVQQFIATSLGVPAEQLWQLEFRDGLVSTTPRGKEGQPR